MRARRMSPWSALYASDFQGTNLHGVQSLFALLRDIKPLFRATFTITRSYFSAFHQVIYCIEYFKSTYLFLYVFVWFFPVVYCSFFAIRQFAFFVYSKVFFRVCFFFLGFFNLYFLRESCRDRFLKMLRDSIFWECFVSRIKTKVSGVCYAYCRHIAWKGLIFYGNVV